MHEMDRAVRLCEQLTACFTDRRNGRFVEHDLAVMLRQRILGIALGCRDINDHDSLRLKVPAPRANVLSEHRHRPQDKGKPPVG